MHVRDRARHALIAVQVGASALLLICAAIFLRSAFAAATVNPGVRTSDTLMVNILNETRRAALLQAVTADPSVAAVAASSPPTPAVVETPVAAETTAAISGHIEQIADRPDCRVAGVLRCARHRRRERPRLHADRTHRGGGRRDRDRHCRAPALADSRCVGQVVRLQPSAHRRPPKRASRGASRVRSSSSASCAM